VNYGPFGAVGYYYTGSGLGTTGLFILSTDSLGAKRDSHGYYLQGTYNPIPKLTLGVSYGESDLSLASGEVDPTLLKSNASYVGQARYALTPWFSLVGEYTHTESTAHNADEAVSDALAAGGILFF
jgi:predicted porin